MLIQRSGIEQEGMADILSKDSLDTSDVIAGIQEHDEVHLGLHRAVVVVKVLLNLVL